jgi:hypothetical protein
MTKFLLIILIFIGIIILFFSYIFKSLRRIFNPGNFSVNTRENNYEKNEEKIIYKKNDIIVLKGDAKDNSK